MVISRALLEPDKSGRVRVGKNQTARQGHGRKPTHRGADHEGVG